MLEPAAPGAPRPIWGQRASVKMQGVLEDRTVVEKDRELLFTIGEGDVSQVKTRRPKAEPRRLLKFFVREKKHPADDLSVAWERIGGVPTHVYENGCFAALSKLHSRHEASLWRFGAALVSRLCACRRWRSAFCPCAGARSRYC